MLCEVAGDRPGRRGVLAAASTRAGSVSSSRSASMVVRAVRRRSASPRAPSAASTPQRIALLDAPGCVAVLTTVLGPLPQLLILLGNALTPGKGFREGPFASEAELRELVDLAEASQVIESDERAMIHSVFELGDTIVREVMVPRTDMVFIERSKTLRQAMSLALRSGFSPDPGRSARTSTTSSASPTSRTSPGASSTSTTAETDRAGRDGDAPGDVRPRLQAGRRAAARDAGRAHARRGRRRRVRRHRRPGHHRGHPRGDRRRDHRRVRPGRDPTVEHLADGSLPGQLALRRRRPRRAVRRRRSTTTTSRPSAACWPSTSAGCRSPAPSSRSRACGSRPRAPAGRRNRIGTVLVAPARAGRAEDRRPAGADGLSSSSIDAEDAKLGDARPRHPRPHRRGARARRCATRTAARTPAPTVGADARCGLPRVERGRRDGGVERRDRPRGAAVVTERRRSTPTTSPRCASSAVTASPSSAADRRHPVEQVAA